MLKNRAIFILFLFFGIFGYYAQSFSQNTENKLDTNHVNQILETAQVQAMQDPELAKAKVLEAMQISKQINYVKGEAQSLYQLGIINVNKGEYAEAKRKFEKSIELFKNINNYRGIANNLSSLGVINSYQGNFTQALSYYYQTLRIFEHINDKKGMANAYNNIGVIYDNQGNFEIALQYYKRSLKLREEINQMKGIAQILNNIGIIYSRQNKLKEAAEAFDRAILLSEKNNDMRTLSSSYGNRGKLHTMMGEYENALYYIKKALQLSIDMNDNRAIAYLTNNLGDVYFNFNKLEEAKKAFRRSSALAEKNGYNVILKENYNSLSQIYAKYKKFDSAYYFHVQYTNIKDSIFNENNSKQIAEMQEKFEAEMKNNQIKLLIKEKELNEVIMNRNQWLIYILSALFIVIIVFSFMLFRAYKLKARTNLRLEVLNRTLEDRVAHEVAKNREKDLMLTQQSRQAALGEMIGNIAHQWRQPLNAIGIIIQNFQEAYEFGEFNETYLKEKVEKGMNIVNYMSQTIDDFRNFFKPNKEKQKFSIKSIVTKATSFIDASLKNANIKLEINFESDYEAFGYPNEYAQVVINIINNARDALIDRETPEPVISIHHSIVNNRSQLIIKDNAGGISAEIIERIFDPYFSTKTIDKGTGLGLYMAKNIIERNMEGILQVKNIENGAAFYIIV